VAGSAAITQGRNATGLQCLARALRLAPANTVAWKWILKALLAPMRPVRTARAVAPRNAA
jgi:hypothetical protein